MYFISIRLVATLVFFFSHFGYLKAAEALIEVPGIYKNICVHCSASKVSDEYHEEARALGTLLGRSKVNLIYGGACTGLMGDLASSFLECGGTNLVGVITRDLELKYSSAIHQNITEKIISNDLSCRKSVMAQRADAFIVLSGGIGTLDEFTAVLAEKQLGEHKKPLILVNTNNSYDSLLRYLRGGVEQAFIQSSHLKLFTVVSSTKEIVPALEKIEDGFIPPETEWWNNTAK